MRLHGRPVGGLQRESCVVSPGLGVSGAEGTRGTQAASARKRTVGEGDHDESTLRIGQGHSALISLNSPSGMGGWVHGDPDKRGGRSMADPYMVHSGPVLLESKFLPQFIVKQSNFDSSA